MSKTEVCVTDLIFCNRLMMFHESIPKRFYAEVCKGPNSVINACEVTVLVFCTSSDHVEYLYQVSKFHADITQTACLVVNPIKVNSFAYLFN